MFYLVLAGWTAACLLGLWLLSKIDPELTPDEHPGDGWHDARAEGWGGPPANVRRFPTRPRPYDWADPRNDR